MDKQKSHDILKQYFERKKFINPSYSLRALSRDLGLSPGFVSGIMTGKKKIPVGRTPQILKVLGMDDIAALQLKKALTVEGVIQKESPTVPNENIDFLNKFYPLDEKKYDLLDKWYNLAILDLTTTKNFKSDSKWIAKVLGISKLEVELALNKLLRMGVLEVKNGILIKTNRKLRLPTNKRRDVVSKFHQQMILQASKELDTRLDSKDFNDRLITGATIATSRDKVEKIKTKINHFLYECVEELTADGPENVFQFNIQVFPLDNN